MSVEDNQWTAPAQVRYESDKSTGWQGPRRGRHTSKSLMKKTMLHTKSTLGQKSMYHQVVLPGRPLYYIEDPVEDSNEITEWVADHVVQFVADCQDVYESLAENNDEWRAIDAASFSDVTVGYPPIVTYTWKKSKKQKSATIPVNNFITEVLVWANNVIASPNIFPTDEYEAFPPNFKKYAEKICTRVFRVYAIIFCNDCLGKRVFPGDAKRSNELRLSFTWFMFFCLKWNLVEEKEYKAIDSVVQPIKKAFKNEKRLYERKELPLNTGGSVTTSYI